MQAEEGRGKGAPREAGEKPEGFLKTGINRGDAEGKWR